MTATQDSKAAAFQALHRKPDVFVIANAWDGGAARLLQGLGFEAIATSSGASAGTLGRLDGKVTREEAREVRTRHVRLSRSPDRRQRVHAALTGSGDSQLS